MRKKLMIAGIVMLTFFMPILNLVNAGYPFYHTCFYPMDKITHFKLGLECIIASLVVSLIYIEFLLLINYILKFKEKKSLNKYFIFNLSLIITMINLFWSLLYFDASHYIENSELNFEHIMNGDFRYFFINREMMKGYAKSCIITIMIVTITFLLYRKRDDLIKVLTIILFIIFVYFIINTILNSSICLRWEELW